jgi:DNA-binding transcriptional LysR family regulator
MDKLRAIKFFCRLVEEKSFSSTARVLGVPPSVLSKTISALERQVQFTLFNRSTRRVALTESGARYYEHCCRLLVDLDEAEAIARDDVAKPAGVLRIGIHPVFQISLCRRVSEFLAENPRVSVEIAHTNSPTALTDEGLDVVLRVGPMESSRLVARQLGSTRLLTCASPAYLATHGEPSHPRELRAHVAIIPGRRDEDSFARWGFQKESERIDVAVPVRAVLSEGVGLGLTAAGGIGIVRIYDIAARPFIDEGTLQPILSDWSEPPTPVYAVIPSRRNVPAKVRAFVEFARTLLLGERAGAPGRTGNEASAVHPSDRTKPASITHRKPT